MKAVGYTRSLPIDAPDYILLSLVQSHAEITCSAACPTGQLANSGRCVPNAIIAQASKRAKLLEARRAAGIRATSNPPSVAAAQPEQLPWLDRDGRSIVAPTSSRPAPPPGMMSIGGPGVALLPPPTAPLSQKVVIERDDGQPADAAVDGSRVSTDQVAALSSEGDDASNAGPPEFVPAVKPDRHRRTKHAREWRDERPRRSSYGGRSRRGDPRPGAMRYNVAQVLGGIY